MRAFRMCPACQREYDDPLDRRFHAQPNACPVCGPQLTLCSADGREVACADPLARVAELLCEGQIVALRGLGGYQLACDATNAEAVARLRARKQRPHKPFALMVADLDAVAACTSPNEAERALLSSPSAPIVLIARRTPSAIAENVAPANATLGVMLPYTPLHHLLLRQVGRPLVMTSGNLSEEPIARDNDEAFRRLSAIADCFLLHNREIYSRYDDSVWLVTADGPQPVRRARGYAPSPVKLPFDTRPTLACGPELKNTFCLTRERYAFVSQHIGDMQNLETYEHYEQTLGLYQRLFHVQPEIIAVDMHPDYQATRYGQALPGQHVAVQHHHAHLAACLADSDHAAPAIGVIWDGTGYGLDGRIWGGEFLLGDARGFQRAARLQYLPLPGGEGAIHRPARLALAYVRALLGDVDLPPALRALSEQECAAVETMLAQQINTPLTSSAGRLFDAVSALLGVCHETSYEAQAAIELETLALGAPLAEAAEPAYPYEAVAVEGVASWGVVEPYVSSTLELRLGALFAALLADLGAGTPVAHIARRFHVTVARMIADICARLADETGLDHVALSGGCFQNRLLLALAPPLLRARGLHVLLHRQIPCNDGGVALGQAVVAHFAAES
jgi:hydrogenase maturation protein HypF